MDSQPIYITEITGILSSLEVNLSVYTTLCSPVIVCSMGYVFYLVTNILGSGTFRRLFGSNRKIPPRH